MTDKQKALEALNNLPEDATLEDAIERLCFLSRVHDGIEQLDRGEGVPHDDVKRRIVDD